MVCSLLNAGLSEKYAVFLFGLEEGDTQFSEDLYSSTELCRVLSQNATTSCIFSLTVISDKRIVSKITRAFVIKGGLFVYHNTLV
jgi:hypothetical protein